MPALVGILLGMGKTNVRGTVRKTAKGVTQVAPHQRTVPAKTGSSDAASHADAAADAAAAADAERGRVIEADLPYPAARAEIEDFERYVEPVDAARVREWLAAAEGSLGASLDVGCDVDWEGDLVDERASVKDRALATILRGPQSRRDTPSLIDAVAHRAAQRTLDLETEAYFAGGGTPSPDLMTARQTLTCVAGHPKATKHAVLLAVMCEGKYAGRAALRNSDPDVVEAAFEMADVGEWHAVTDTGTVRPTLQTHRLDPLIDIANRGNHTPSDPRDVAWHRELARSLRAHPAITGKQKQRLRPPPPDRRPPQTPEPF